MRVLRTACANRGQMRALGAFERHALAVTRKGCEDKYARRVDACFIRAAKLRDPVSVRKKATRNRIEALFMNGVANPYSVGQQRTARDHLRHRRSGFLTQALPVSVM